MLLAIDVGNTNTVLGVYEAAELRAHWRIETRTKRTADEIAVLLKDLMALASLTFANIDAGILASVVPPVLHGFQEVFERHMGTTPLIVGPGIKTGMPILYENPREVGADRIVNAVAAYERFKQAVIVVDFGTATTFDVVTPRGEYMGGTIVPGVQVSTDALYHAAAKLPRVEIVAPKSAIGRNTVTSMQAGLVFGYAGLVDGLVERIRRELDFPVRVIATGGLAALIAKESRVIEETDEMLTLAGLKILYDRNRSPS